MTQQEITKWEIENFKDIIGWEIHYREKDDKIIFKMKDKTVKEFARIKTSHPVS